MHKQLIQIDLDGVLNIYNGNYNENEIPGIHNDAYEFIKKLSKKYSLELFTVRNQAVCRKWLEENNLSKFFNGISNIKNYKSIVILDDRAINFNGNYEKAYQDIINFKPYWK